MLFGYVFLPAFLLSKLPELSASPVESRASSSFVGRSGSHFTLNGKPFYFGGTNAYWLAQFADADITKSFTDMKAQGLTVCRTWAFNDVTTAQNYGAYYQLWSSGHATINYGPYGLDRLDAVVAAAEAAGIKLILPLVNNWSDYGGMDVYVSQLNSGGTHDTFYTNSAIQTAFKNYISVIVNRYKDSTAVMAWELANEPRCAGSTGSASSACKASTITSWVNTIASYIKSLDGNHLVGIGDEGFMGWTNTTEYVYDAGAGLDFQANLELSSVDFGTFHMYPVSWGYGSDYQNWGDSWIQTHANVQGNVGKPVILEEFGYADASTRAATYTSWYGTVESTNLAGVLYWQFGDTLSTGASWDDGYAIYPTDTAVVAVIEKDAATQAAKNA